jgi:2-polyprenyl-6-hydroxyphenyl methylase/3-demethylubiquinone-9 3-methyltransferase
MTAIPPRVRNDPAQYDDLAGQWWDPRGTFAMLHWLAGARAALIPPAARPGAVLVDMGCGAGLLAPHVAGLGYRLVGVDLTRSALVQAARHGVTAVQGDVTALPVADGCADVVCAGEILEHVTDLPSTLREACRVLRPGGTLVIDTIAATWLARLLVITVAERIPGAAPPGLHDPALFVDRQVLITECARGTARAVRAAPVRAVAAALVAPPPADGQDGPYLVKRGSLPGPRHQGKPGRIPRRELAPAAGYDRDSSTSKSRSAYSRCCHSSLRMACRHRRTAKLSGSG